MLNGTTRSTTPVSTVYSGFFRETIALLEREPESVEDQRLEQYIVSRIRPLKGIEHMLGIRGAALLHRARTNKYPSGYLSRMYARALYRSMCSAEDIEDEAGRTDGSERRWECHDRAFEWVQEDLARLLAHVRESHRAQPAGERQPLSTAFARAGRKYLVANVQDYHPAVAQMLVFLSIQQRLRLLPRIEQYFGLLDDRIHVHVTSPLALTDENRAVIRAVTVGEYESGDTKKAIAARMRFSFTTRPQRFTSLTAHLVQEIMREQLAQLRY
jgi:hypothetical protein